MSPVTEKVYQLNGLQSRPGGRDFTGGLGNFGTKKIAARLEAAI